jgi:2-phospho-L-lactate/phosphoenolpyruvate guanylyltransferase
VPVPVDNLLVAVLVPVKRFDHAKGRLGTLLGSDERVELARWLAERVIASAGDSAIFVACDNEIVAEWADAAGAEVLWCPGMGLNGAVDTSRETIAGKGFDHIVIAHSDLPFASDLGRLATRDTITIVPDRALGGTNVMALPVGSTLTASYGANSFRSHVAMALDESMSGRFRVEVRRDPYLSLDVDTPADLRHPMLHEELPPWLRTILANRP